MAFKKVGSAFPITELKFLDSVDDWHNFKKQASATAVEEKVEKVKKDKKESEKNDDFEIVANIDTDNFIYIHATIMAGVETEDNGYWITSATEKFINDNNDAWTSDDLLTDYTSFRSATTFVEHDQNIERAKGKCVDAIARKMADTILVDVLFSVDKRHEDLVANIKSGIINAVSMGCSTEKTICTICGNVASDPNSYCIHLKRGNKGSYFKCDDGKKRKAAELCKNNRFFDVSLVGSPAFAGAVFRKILASSEVSNHLLANILSSKIEETLNQKHEGITKDASIENSKISINLTENGNVEISSGNKTFKIINAFDDFEYQKFKGCIENQKSSNDIISKIFGDKSSMTFDHPIQQSPATDYKISYDNYSNIPGAVIPIEEPEKPVEIVLSSKNKKVEKTSRIKEFECQGCGFKTEEWQVKAASIDAGYDKVLVCPECSFVSEIIEENNNKKEAKKLHPTDIQQLKDLGFPIKEISKLDKETAELIIMKSVPWKKYRRDPLAWMRSSKLIKKVFVANRDIPVDYDDGFYWFNPKGKSIISKGEKLLFVGKVDQENVEAFLTQEGENVFMPINK